jgi:hypothetical protein
LETTVADVPDFFADGFSLTVGPFGVTVTFQLTQPTLEPGPHVDPGAIVARARMTPALAAALAQALGDVAAQQANIQQTETRVKH